MATERIDPATGEVHEPPSGLDPLSIVLRLVKYGLAVRLRVSVDDSAHLTFRLSIPGAERALEAVFADRVAVAKALLGDGYTLLRATGASC